MAELQLFCSRTSVLYYRYAAKHSQSIAAVPLILLLAADLYSLQIRTNTGTSKRQREDGS